MTDKPNVPPDNESAHDEEPAANPVIAEAKKYRKRAQAAEQSLSELQQELQDKAARLNELEQTVADLDRGKRIDQLLIEADAIDLESARLLTELAVAEMDEPDAAEAVQDLIRRKPFLFRTRQHVSRTSGASSARPEHHSPVAEAIEHAADAASSTGNRLDLLRYLRLKRTAR